MRTPRLLPLVPDQRGGQIKRRAFLQTPFNEQDGQFSPDGKWVAYSSNDSGPDEVYAVPYPGPGGKRQISSGGGRFPRWRRDGTEIFYATQDGQLKAAEVAARNGTLEVGKIQTLFGGIVTTRGYLYDASADGQKFIVAQDSTAASAPPLTLIQNWTALLKR